MQNQRPQFSILIPTTGRGDLIQMALQSVLDQTFQDFEIVVADASRSETIRRTITDRGDARIRYVATPAGGPLEGFDFAAKQAVGEYVLWLDDDNYLLPWALELFADTIRRNSVDIVTANHLYYYDAAHPRHYLRNTVGIVPFSGREYTADLLRVIAALFSFVPRGGGKLLPRFHTSATLIRRAVLERAIERLGFVILTDLPNAQSMQLILFAFARSYAFIDWPVVLVGRLGVSMSQVWSTAARKRFRKTPFRIRLSPVTAYTRINGVLENYLRVRELLPDRVGSTTINYEKFAELYLRELVYLDSDAITAIRNWRGLFRFLATLPSPDRDRLRREAHRLTLKAPIVFLGRRLGLHRLWRVIYGRIQRRRLSKIPARERMQKNAEFEIPIPERYGVNSIETLAAHVREIVRDATGRDIAPSISADGA